MSAKIVIIDDHRLFASGIGALLNSIGEVAVFASIDDARDALRQAAPDIVLLDFLVPGSNAECTLAELKHDLAVPRILVISASLSPDDRATALRAGADGFLTKHIPPEQLLRAVGDALDGNVFDVDRTGQEAADQIGLTGRQFDVLLLVSKGCSNREIARILGIGEETVKSHVHAILERLGVRNRTEAVAAARAEGIV